MCMAVQRILPQLRRLRFSQQPCCHLMFEGLESICPKLEEICLHLIDNDLRLDCSHVRHRRKCLSYRIRSMARLTDMAQKVIEDGLMPELVHFTICGRSRYDVPGESSFDKDTRFPCYYRIDVLKKRTTVFPIFLPRKTLNGNRTELQQEMIKSFDGSWMLYKDDKTGQTYNLVGRGEQLQALVLEKTEQEALQHTNFRQLNTPPLERLIANFERMRKEHPIQTRLWYLEGQLNRPLLKVKEYDFMEFPSLPARERIDNEGALFAQLDDKSQQMLKSAPF